MEAFSNQLRKLMASKRWNQVKAANELGLTQSQVSDYLSGKSEPYLSTAAAVAKRLGISLDELSGVVTAKIAIREEGAVYQTEPPYDQWIEKVRRRWQRKGSARAEMELAIRILFPEDADKMIDLLNRS
jgi:transcriptional regulator with XRE-family HTH domain